MFGLEADNRKCLGLDLTVADSHSRYLGMDCDDLSCATWFSGLGLDNVKYVKCNRQKQIAIKKNQRLFKCKEMNANPRKIRHIVTGEVSRLRQLALQQHVEQKINNNSGQ